MGVKTLRPPARETLLARILGYSGSPDGAPVFAHLRPLQHEKAGVRCSITRKLTYA